VFGVPFFFEMKKSIRPLETLIWTGLVLVMLAVSAAYIRERSLAPRQSVSPAKNAPNASPTELPIVNEITQLGLTNQFGHLVNAGELHGKVWLVDIVFTRCPGPCAVMTRRMKEISDLLRPELPVGFLTLTTDPDFDTPAVLGRYAEFHEADTNRWLFLTGEKSQIGKVAMDGFKLVAQEKAEKMRSSKNDLFIHSTTFGLIDRHARLRGVVETIAAPVDEDDQQTFVDPWETDYKPQILRKLQQLLLEE
jgi:protein SCO1/2